MMLSLLMMLASDPVAVTTIIADDDLKARLRNAQQIEAGCPNGALIQTVDGATHLTVEQRPPAASRLGANDLMFRSGDPVQMTLLLERSVDHCSVPISTDLNAPGSALPRFGHGN